MIRTNPPLGCDCAQLPRRDILAICAYLNRKPANASDPTAQPGGADNLLEKLATAARMQ